MELKKAVKGDIHQFSAEIVDLASKASVCNINADANNTGGRPTSSSHSKHDSISSDAGNASDLSLSDPEVK